MNIKILRYIIITIFITAYISFAQNNNLLNLNQFDSLNKNPEINFSLDTNNNKLIVKAIIPNNYYAYLESKIANKILFFADNKQINTTYPKGEKYHDDTIIKGEQEFILNDIDINKINFIKATYQLCSAKDNVCLQPQSKVIYGEEIDIPNNIITDEKPENATSIENYIKGSDNIFITLILIFAAGLASVLLPCTYPLLSITVSILGTTTDEKNNKKSSVLASLLFALGVITTYTLLGAVVSVAGFAFHKTILFGSIGYNPIVLTILVLLFLYFTFSMAGFYEIKAPSFLQSAKTNAYAKKNQSIFHKYIMGLLAGIVATPCAAPIIAVILEIGFLNPVFATLYMAVYALGFASVLFILGTFASILTKMPKAGTWMVYVKYIFTFLMMIISFYYANILFGVLGFNKISYILASVTILVFAVLVYIIKNKSAMLSALEIKIFVSVVIISIALGCTYGFIKQKNEVSNMISYNEALELSKQNNKPILIDFSAVWCANCYELKEKVFVNEELKKFIDDNLIFTEVDVDKYKNISDEYNVKWLPWIIVIDSNKNILYTKNSFSSFDDKMALSIKEDLEKVINK
ncbi:thiol-disulfide interchange protein [Brachyspira hyodysenteriae]|uniref:Thiol:disulfide interchange protein n=1 Tax=Brachyspira hyodysenteriae ATCC 27164 TaxID=1266923 RepID=A0A3B6VX32_BRAHO|nr:cytochrome c biogenesis protein CcdA [Brachyspira hyodysenteriae]ANN64350.1 thiol:disulfide interchange protein [Brachyspira hyodysenteriae ATCC 27164]KLI27580.1 thiol-disulfide interchange protein [Brachyspira hyodysenteriae]MCZ9924508.1 thioredoxin family protein [Brachyspira hyodysenteriae]TVL68355.1 thiol:disulfide interchange protein [Brachyspira hyodysenteriae]TVL72207.1 thiol:disulfide interchange protein [Brachyspira hyodysenteriae]